jgi:hypothetical protein
MEPSSTPFRRAGVLLTIIALMFLSPSGPAAARGFAGMGRAQAVHVVPRIPVRSHALRGDSVHQHVLAPRSALVGDRLRRHRFGTAAGFSGPYGYPYLMNTEQPDGSALAAGYDAEPGFEAYDRPACVRPLVISIKPTRHATEWPRVIYGRPPAC